MMNRSAAFLPQLGLLAVLLVPFLFAEGRAQTVRILYYNGNISVTSGGSTGAPRLGQQLKKEDKVKIGNASSLQLSVDGKVLKYDKAMTLKISDAISRAGTGENSVVANSARTLAGASGAGRSARTSVAGATRASGKGKEGYAYLDSIQTDAVNTGTMRLNSEVESITGLGDAGGLIRKAADGMKREAIILLQPRSTAVTSGPLRFRWKKSPGVGNYVLTVRNFLGDEIYRAETADTTLVWNDPVLDPEAIYSWSLADRDNPKNSYGASFHRLSEMENSILEEGLKGARAELGEGNPALPLILGTFYADNGCYGQAAEFFTRGALAGDEHRETYWEMACEQYLYNMFLPVEEAFRICEGE